MFGSKWENLLEDWREMQNGKLHNVYFLQILFGVMKSLRMKRLGYVSCMGEVISACGIVFGEGKWKQLLWRLGRR
jgi:hypothetical protein